MMHSGKMGVRRKSHYAIPQRPRQFAKRRYVSRSYLKLLGIIAAVFCLLPVVSPKPTPNQPCKPTQHWVEKEDGSRHCIDCGTCPEGQGLSTECGTSELLRFNTMVTCVPCTGGVSFSRYKDSSQCIPCASCSSGQVVDQICSPEQDIKCANKCSSKDRYYDEDMGDCLKCSRCCGRDDTDVVVNECQEKLGAGSNMVCSFDSSVNRCDDTTPQPTPSTSYVSPEHDGPYSTQKNDPSTQKSDHSTEAKPQDNLVIIVIAVVITVVLVVCLYFFKKRLAKMLSWCNRAVENEDHHNSLVMKGKLTSQPKETAENSCRNAREKDKSNKLGKALTDSNEPLLHLEEGIVEDLEDAQTSEKKDSKLLSSLLECDSYQFLKKICECLDTAMAGRDYRDVCFHYGINRYEIASVLEKERDGPSRALIDKLATSHVQLTIADFVSVVRNVAKRGDVAKLLEEYDSQRE